MEGLTILRVHYEQIFVNNSNIRQYLPTYTCCERKTWNFQQINEDRRILQFEMTFVKGWTFRQASMFSITAEYTSDRHLSVNQKLDVHPDSHMMYGI